MIEVFIYGCTTCGTNALTISRIQKMHGKVTIYNSVQKDNREKHVEYLKSAGMETNSYPPIIVLNGGERITRLQEWKSLQS